MRETKESPEDDIYYSQHHDEPDMKNCIRSKKLKLLLKLMVKYVMEENIMMYDVP